MRRIDSHQHFWNFDPVRDSWINEEMSVIRRHFGPQDLQPLLEANGFEACITVQSDQSEAENEFQLANAVATPFIRGIVGWVDLRASNIEERLQHYKNYPLIKGFRHVLQGEQQRDLMLTPSFIHGLSLLHKYNFSYDILIFPDQLSYAAEMVRRLPDTSFVIDHLAKPYIKNGEIDQWKKDMKTVGELPNVSCKISGMVTEADWKNWKASDFRPYMDVVVEAFGMKRIMFGSDWPVCLVAAEYADVVKITEDYFSSFSKDEQQQFFSTNASEFYKLSK